MPGRIIVTSLGVLAILIAVNSPAESRRQAVGSSPVPSTLRVLLIGNSYTYYNNLPVLLTGLAASDRNGPQIHAEMIARVGATLRQHSEDARTLDAIDNGRWDFVVLQEQSMIPISNPDTMSAAAEALDARIRKAGARTVLLLTWPRQDAPENQNKLNATYERIAARLNAVVAPVGIAFRHALEINPQLLLYTTDKSHPNAAGSYLAACVIYSTLVRRETEGMTCSISGYPVSILAVIGNEKVDLVNLENRECRMLQRVSWETARRFESEQRRASRNQSPR